MSKAQLNSLMTTIKYGWLLETKPNHVWVQFSTMQDMKKDFTNIYNKGFVILEKNSWELKLKVNIPL